MIFSKSFKTFQQQINNPLYKNSFFIALSRGINAASGFLFWLLAARIYSVEDVGLSSALLSYLELILVFSSLGFNYSIIRFLPMKNKKDVFNTYFTIISLSSILFTVLFILTGRVFVTEFSIIKIPVYAIIFTFSSIANCIGMLTGNTFIAMRDGGNYLFQNIIRLIRIPLLALLGILKGFGIFVSVGLAYILCSLISISILHKSIGINFKVNLIFLKESLKFSSFNYLANNLALAPEYILPIMVLSMLGKKEAAIFYIAFSIGNLVLIIPSVMGISLFVEGSHGENLRDNFVRSTFATYFILVPTVMLIILFGKISLNIFGSEYTRAYDLLCLFSLSSIFFAIYSLIIPVLNVKMKVVSIFILNFFICIMLLGLSYNFILRFGLIGIGYAWIITYGLLAIGLVLYIITGSILIVRNQVNNHG